jgi:mRNA interferase MazF
MEVLRRGDIVLAVAPGDYGKPRPAVVVQSDIFNATHSSIAVCLVTSTSSEGPVLRISIDPALGSGLRVHSQIMVDKIIALKRERIRETIGRIDAATAQRLDRALAVFLGLV